ncbi:MAG: hypothetical protein V1691_00670 [Chloroflexota bacterium]
MWHNKKFLLGMVVAVVLVLGSIGGVALAQTDNSNTSPTASNLGTLLDRALAIYQEKTGVTIDSAVLKDSITQAGQEARSEAMKNQLQSLVDQGRLTQEQADQYLQWWQSKPDVPGNFGFPGLRGHFGFRGMGGMWGRGGTQAPAQSSTQ